MLLCEWSCLMKRDIYLDLYALPPSLHDVGFEASRLFMLGE